MGYANLCRLLTAAHSGTRVPGRGARAAASRRSGRSWSERNEGLVCLSGCARHGLAVRNPNAARAAGEGVRPRPLLRRAPAARSSVATLAVTQRCESWPRRSRVETVATGDVHAHHPRRTRAAGRPCRRSSNRTSLDGCEAERRGNHELSCGRLPRSRSSSRDDRDAVERTGRARRAPRVRPDRGRSATAIPTSPRTASPRSRSSAAVCNRAFAERYSGRNGHRSKARARLDEELKLIDELGLAGFFLLHWEVLELARELRRRGARPRLAALDALPPGRGRGSSVGSIVCYLTGLSHVDPVARGALARPLPQPRAWRRCPTSTSTFRATSARS